MASRPAADGRDLGQERAADLRDRRHRRRGQGPGRLRLRPRRAEVLRGEPGHRRGVHPRQPGVPAAAARRRHHRGRRPRARPGHGDRPGHPPGRGAVAARADHAGARRVLAGGPAAARRVGPHVEPRGQDRRAAGLLDAPDRVVRPGARSHAGTGPRHRHLLAERRGVRPHRRHPRPGHRRVRDVDRAHPGRQRLRQPRDDGRGGQPAAVRRVEEVRGRPDGQGRGRELRRLPARLGAGRCRVDQRRRPGCGGRARAAPPET